MARSGQSVTALAVSAVGYAVAQFSVVRRHSHFMTTRTKRILISAIIAIVLEVSWLGLASVAQRTSNGQDIFTLCLIPFYVIGAYLSGSAEDPSGFIIYFSMFLAFWGVVYLAVIGWSKLRKIIHDA